MGSRVVYVSSVLLDDILKCVDPGLGFKLESDMPADAEIVDAWMVDEVVRFRVTSAAWEGDDGIFLPTHHRVKLEAAP